MARTFQAAKRRVSRVHPVVLALSGRPVPSRTQARVWPAPTRTTKSTEHVLSATRAPLAKQGTVAAEPAKETAPLALPVHTNLLGART